MKRKSSPPGRCIFDMGHFIEDMIAGYLRRAGFELKTHDSQGKQFGFSVADEQIRGHIDGVICSGQFQ